MIVLVLLILTSVALASLFLAAFIWAVRSGQYDDTCTPSMRLLTDEPPSSRTETDPPTQSNPKNP
ncbi:MAG TPA: cbb3-type cytochrome oxidase assembly protein CcoS [Methylomirabilota bacterium]|nr:cbb3-type cytochrome oxidase assembly protein CcoS [Methylomirabilota bacterium]